MRAGTAQRPSVPELVSECDTGSSAVGIKEVYEENFRYVWRCLRSLGVHDAHLDDALQDVFIVVQRRLPDFDGRAELTTWLYAIALRIARKYRERARRVAGPSSAPTDACDLEAPGVDLDNALHCSERLLVARAALASLSDDKREVFVLAQVEQKSAPEIARILQIPVNTVYSRLRVARQAFAAEVERLQTRTKRSAP